MMLDPYVDRDLLADCCCGLLHELHVTLSVASPLGSVWMLRIGL